MSKLKQFLQDLEAAKDVFPESEMKNVKIILGCCAASKRYPRNAVKHLLQIHKHEYNHIGGLTFTGYEGRDIPLKDIADGLTKFVKSEQSINIENWLLEINDHNRMDMILGNQIETEAERLALILKYKEQGYTHQVYCNDLDAVFYKRRSMQFTVIGKLSAQDIKETGTGVTMFNFSEDRQICGITDFMNDDFFQKLLKEWAYRNRAIIHPDLLFFWESKTEENKEVVVINKASIKRTLYPFQSEGVDMCSAFKKTLLADDMGLGKTIQAISTIHANNAWPCLFVVPPSILYNWAKEIKMTIGIDATIVHNKSIEDAVGQQAVVITYSTAEAMAAYADQFQSIVVDESHNVKEKSTKRYKAILNLAMGKEWRLLLSGTPILNRTAELIPQLTILGYLNEETSGVFKRKYCQKQPNVYALQELNTKLRNLCMVRRNKSDVDIQLPEVTRTIIECEIDNRKQYNMVLNDLANYLESIKNMTKEEITKAMRAEALIRTSNLKKIAAEGYREQVKEFCLNAIDSGQSIIVLCSTHTAMDYYQKVLCTKFRIDGSVNVKERQNLINEYQALETPAAFIIGIRSGGVGVTLTKADYVIHAEKDWVPLYHDQGTSRTHRIGRTAHVNEYFFVGIDTIDKRIMEIMEEKRLIAEVGTGADNIASSVTTSVFKDVMKREFDYDTENISGSEEGLPALE